ncbi:MAG TPA: ubiquinol-cytochrome c reductase iron-sulfur subunit [Gammaproteobacteria bacterium]|nr:ubiquinol-cytochrome c reductase iron-sulfur subunit [Gammaproteobacteria bacterium]OUX33025.1 MAG: ubiquinol-cytochrome c reductase iron-sulfur subunit [Gammaproteobacteria bacterium TMED260]HAU25424.1 ubiquinol-cytochrome c reductase iron-sulfur subunit [Gammaproteobacteria bacterium]HBJ89222.1 ubiquinol-cytochrome c reductase iron-sulfur subunit [Gammaproteobacteria bacterium]HBQ00717.1 ubiquinol-cytochrome c reductase iron-sulfur subunit [Gammaproteobacteria bacterium]
MTDDSTKAGRRRFLVGSTSVVGAAGIVGAAVPFLGSWNPSAKARAAGAPVRIDISRLADGEMLGPIPAWRGRPIFIVKRSEGALAALNEDPDRLTDPESQDPEQPNYAQNEYRSRTPEVLVLVGLCPHLFCSPTPHVELRPQPFDSDWRGGFFCPCHGSRFDLAGRVYSGSPASRNMQVPPYSFEGDNVLVIGIDEETAA